VPGPRGPCTTCAAMHVPEQGILWGRSLALQAPGSPWLGRCTPVHCSSQKSLKHAAQPQPCPAPRPAGNKLWGGTPFARYVHVGPEHMAAWNATAHNETSVECLHKIVCVAYYLPHKYQVSWLGQLFPFFRSFPRAAGASVASRQPPDPFWGSPSVLVPRSSRQPRPPPPRGP
jgi:hypothetical protein